MVEGARTNETLVNRTYYRNVAQLVRASARQAEGRRFESDRSYHFLSKSAAFSGDS